MIMCGQQALAQVCCGSQAAAEASRYTVDAKLCRQIEPMNDINLSAPVGPPVDLAPESRVHEHGAQSPKSCRALEPPRISEPT